MPKLAALLSQQFTVFLYDRRGRNASGNQLPYSIDREIEDIGALLGEAGEPAHLVGISTGAILAILAASKGLRVAKLAVYEPPFSTSPDGPRPPADSVERISSFLDSGQKSSALKYFLHKVVGIPSLIANLFPLFPQWSKMKSAAQTLPYDMAIWRDYSLGLAGASQIRMPALVAGGTKSPVYLRNAVKATAEAMPNAKLVFLVGQNHDVKAPAFAPVLTDFFFS
jgi:pimeloyl-ACP methyl ester carboxylesterase